MALTDLVEEGQWIWLNSKVKAVYTNLGLKQPNNHGQDENCAVLGTSSMWNDLACHQFKHYICEQPAE